MSDVMATPPQPVNYTGLQTPADPVGSFLKSQALQSTMNLQGAQTGLVGAQTLIQGIQAQRQMQYPALLQQTLANPTASNFAALASMFPDQHAGLAEGWNMIHTQQQQAEIDQASRAFSALQNGRPDVAMNVAQTHLDALKNNTASDVNSYQYQKQLSDAQNIVDLIQNDPKAAQGQLGAVLSSAMGPQGFAENFSHLMTTPATIGKANAEATTAQAGAAVAPQQAQANLAQTQANVANTNSEIENRAARFGLDQQQFQTQTELKLRELNYTQNVPNMRGNTADIVNTSAVDSVQHGMQADRIGNALSQIDALKQNGQWTSGALSDLRAKGQSVLGTQDDWNTLRTEYNALRNGSIFSTVQGGRTTDADLKVLNQGFPAANADPTQIETFLHSMQNVELRQARVDEGKAAWGSAFGYMGPATRDAAVGGQQVARGTSFAEFNKGRIAQASTTPSTFAAPNAPVGVQSGAAAGASAGTVAAPLTGAAARYNRYVTQ